MKPIVVACCMVLVAAAARAADYENLFQHWVWSTAHRIPAETTSEESGYFSIVEGKNGRIYIGTAQYGDNAYLVEFDPATKQMVVVVDVEKEIGVDRKGFAAQAKIHTRNNFGASGRVYFGTKQGYPQEGESRTDYLSGHPMSYDPLTGKTRVYEIPVKHQGVISVTPDESRGVAYISTSSDERPIESTHFMILNLRSGQYRDLMDCQHMYAFVVVDYLGRAYHPILGGDVARYDPHSGKLQRLKKTIDGEPLTPDSLLAHPQSHPINWEISPDGKTLYSVAMSGNQLYAYDLTAATSTLTGRSLGPLIPVAKATDCRAMCVAPDGTVWAGVAATFEGRGQFLHVASWRPGDAAPTDHGPIAISNPDYTTLTDANGKSKPWHHGIHHLEDHTLLPRYVVMGICAASNGTVYLTTLYPFTLHEIRIPRVAGITTVYHHNSHADVILTRLLMTDTLDGTGHNSPLRLTSLHTDQVPDRDTSRQFSEQFDIPVFDSIQDALTLGTDKLAVDGVLLIAEHGSYPRTDTGQVVYPKRRMFTEVAETFRKTGRVVPVFSDKHLADNWKDAKWLYDTAREMNIPLMAGSSLPVLWRSPPVDVRRGAQLEQIVAVSFGDLDAYGFHALEMVQVLVERRARGETGVKSVQCMTGEAVWQAAEQGIYDQQLLEEALSRLQEKPIPPGKNIEDLVKDPVLFVVDYHDGLRANVLTLNGAVSEWAVGWRYADSGETQSTLFREQSQRPFMHFTCLLLGIEKMMLTGQPAWPAERTLLTSGMLNALMMSKRDGGQRLETPWLDIHYQSEWNWRQPPPPPPGRSNSER